MKNKVVLLDRDGVINVDNEYYTYREEDFIVNEGVFETLKTLSEKGFKLAVITNQSGIAKSLYTAMDVKRLHHSFDNKCKALGINISGFFFCPHHPEYGNCICRKPDSLLAEKALALLNADILQSWFIGDRQRDIDCGKKVGLNTILITSNQNLNTVIQQIIG